MLHELKYEHTVKLRDLYRLMKHNASFYEENKYQSNQMRSLNHNIFYGAISEIKTKTGFKSDNALDYKMKKKKTTDDHIYSPEKYARVLYQSILQGMTEDEFIERITPLTYTIEVTPIENKQLQNLESKNNKNNTYTIDKYKELGIVLKKGYMTYHQLPIDYIDEIQYLKERKYD